MHVVIVDAANQTPFYDYSLCRALAKAGCSVELVSAPFIYGELPEVQIPLRRWFGRVSVLPLMARFWRLRRLMRALEYPFDWALLIRHIRTTLPDVVHVQWAMLPPIDGLAFRAIRQLGPRLIYTVHDVRPHESWRLGWLSSQPLLPLADELIVHTEANKQSLLKATHILESKVHVIPHGNLADDAGPQLPKGVARADLGLPPDVRVALFFGAIKPYKGLADLIDAFRRVVEQLPSARLLIVGYPTEPFARYRRAIQQYGLDDHVVVRLGFIPHDQVSRYFCAADVVALPYVETSFSGVLIAAYSFGRPVVASETGGLPEVIEQGRTGYVVPPSNPSALAQALVRILADRERAEKMGERARELALTKFAWPAVAKATLQVYRRAW